MPSCSTIRPVTRRAVRQAAWWPVAVGGAQSSPSGTGPFAWTGLSAITSGSCSGDTRPEVTSRSCAGQNPRSARVCTLSEQRSVSAYCAVTGRDLSELG